MNAWCGCCWKTLPLGGAARWPVTGAAIAEVEEEHRADRFRGMLRPTSRYSWPLASFRAATISSGSGSVHASLRFLAHRAGSRDRLIGYPGAIRRHRSRGVNSVLVARRGLMRVNRARSRRTRQAIQGVLRCFALTRARFDGVSNTRNPSAVRTKRHQRRVISRCRQGGSLGFPVPPGLSGRVLRRALRGSSLPV